PRPVYPNAARETVFCQRPLRLLLLAIWTRHPAAARRRCFPTVQFLSDSGNGRKSLLWLASRPWLRRALQGQRAPGGGGFAGASPPPGGSACRRDGGGKNFSHS